MKRHWVVVPVLAGALWPVLARVAELSDDQLPPLPSYQIRRASGPLRIDGKLDEEAWRSAEVITLQYWWPDQTGPRQDTKVRLLWDDEALYISYACVDQDITALLGQHDDPTYKDDCVEAFLLPDLEHKPTAYVGLEMNARAVLYDYLFSHGVALIKRYDMTDCRLATWLDGTLSARGDQDQGWSLEVRAPFANFDDLTAKLPPKPGDTWRAQLNRWDGVEPDRALSLWTHSGMKGPNPHNPERFGYLVFAGD